MPTVHERHYVAPDEEVIVTEPVAEAEESSVAQETSVRPLRVLSMAIAFAGLIVVTLLGIRLLLMMAGADPNAAFADFIYDVTGPLVAPFDGIADNQPIESDGVFDSAAAVAMIVYALATGLAMLLVGILESATPASRETTVR